MLEIIGDILERIGIVILILLILFSIIDLSERMSNIEAQIQMLIEMEQGEYDI